MISDEEKKQDSSFEDEQPEQEARVHFVPVVKQVSSSSSKRTSNNRSASKPTVWRKALFTYCCLFLYLAICKAVGWFSIKQLCEEVADWTPFILISSLLMMLSGGSCIAISNVIGKKASRKNRILVKIVLILASVCTLFCISCLIYLVAVVQKNLNRLERCEFDEYKRTCSCVLVNRHQINFTRDLDCDAVKSSLRNLTIGVSALFGVGLIISILTALSAYFLLRKEKRDRYEQSRRKLRGVRRKASSSPLTSRSSPLTSRLHSSHTCATALSPLPTTRSSESWRMKSEYYTRPLSDGSYEAYTLDDMSSEYSYDGVSPPSYNDAIKSLS